MAILTKKPRSSIDKGWAWMVLFATFINSFICALVYTTGIFHFRFLKSLSIESRAVISLCSGLHISFIGLASPLVNKSIKRFGYRKTIFIGTFLSFSGFVIASFVCDSIVLLVITYGAMTGLGFSFICNPSLIVLGFYFKTFRNIAYVIVATGIGLGTIVYAVVGNIVLDMYDLQGTLLLLGGLSAHGFITGGLIPPLALKKYKLDKRTNKYDIVITRAKASSPNWKIYDDTEGSVEKDENNQPTRLLSRSDVLEWEIKKEEQSGDSDNGSDSSGAEVSNDQSKQSSIGADEKSSTIAHQSTSIGNLKQEEEKCNIMTEIDKTYSKFSDQYYDHVCDNQKNDLVREMENTGIDDKDNIFETNNDHQSEQQGSMSKLNDILSSSFSSYRSLRRVVKMRNYYKSMFEFGRDTEVESKIIADELSNEKTTGKISSSMSKLDGGSSASKCDIPACRNSLKELDRVANGTKELACSRISSRVCVNETGEVVIENSQKYSELESVKNDKPESVLVESDEPESELVKTDKSMQTLDCNNLTTLSPEASLLNNHDITTTQETNSKSNLQNIIKVKSIRICEEYNQLFSIPFFILAANLFLVDVGLSCVYVHFPAFAISQGTSSSKASYLIIAMGLGNIICWLLMGVMINGIKSRTFYIYIFSCLLAGIVSFVCPMICQYYDGQIIFAFLFSLFGNSYIALMYPLMEDLFGLQGKNRALGVGSVVCGMGMLVGPPLGGLMYDLTGSYYHTFILSGSCYVLAGLVMFIVAVQQKIVKTYHKY